MKKRIIAITIAFIFMLTLIPAVPVTFAQTSGSHVRVLIEPILEFDEIGTFSEGLAAAGIDNKWGLIDKTGKVVVPIEFGWIEAFSEGLALANKGGGFVDGGSIESVGIKGGAWGFIDKEGNTVIPFEYDYYSRSFNEGIAAVKKGDKWGYIDKTGKAVLPIEYDWAWDFNEGLGLVKKEGKFSFIDTNGKTALTLKYSGAASFSEGFAEVYKGTGKDARYGYIDKTGNEVIPFKYDYTTPFSEGLAMVGKIGENSQIIDKKGNIVATLDTLYFSSSKFTEGLMVVVRLDNWEYSVIDTAGNNIVPVGYYDWLPDFSGSLVKVSKGGKEGFIDKTGNVVVPLEYYSANAFNEGLAAVRIGMPPNCNWGILELTNEKPSPPTSTPALTPSQQSKTVSPTASTVFVNGIAKNFEAYNIDGSNHFKLRDLAVVLNGTDKQFAVGYDEATKAITLTSGEAYNSIGGEMVQGDGKVKTSSPTQSNIFLDGKELNLNVYNIGGNNFFKLRDLMGALDVAVTYNSTTKDIGIDTSKPYTD